MKVRHIICTLNNPTITLRELKDRAQSIGATSFRAQLEKGENGTPHFQFFMSFKNAV